MSANKNLIHYIKKYEPVSLFPYENLISNQKSIYYITNWLRKRFHFLINKKKTIYILQNFF